MKLMKRTGIYQASNVSFDPKTVEAHSYRWWKFVGIVEGKVVFNDYRYSNTTSKHQSKVRSLLQQLGIDVDLYLPLPKGIPTAARLQDIITEGEETLCNQFLTEQLKRQERYQRAKAQKLKRKLEDYLENDVHFRDYIIKPRAEFGIYNAIAVHQCVDSNSIERDVENALHNFQRDGFGSIVFYV